MNIWVILTLGLAWIIAGRLTWWVHGKLLEEEPIWSKHPRDLGQQACRGFLIIIGPVWGVLLIGREAVIGALLVVRAIFMVVGELPDVPARVTSCLMNCIHAHRQRVERAALQAERDADEVIAWITESK